MIVRTAKLRDGELIDLIRDLFAIYPSGAATLGLVEGISKNYSSAEVVETYEHDLEDRNIQTVTFSFQKQEPDVVQFARGISNENADRQYGPRNAFGLRIASAYFDELAFFTAAQRSGNYRSLEEGTTIAVSRALNARAAPIDASSDDDARRLSKVVTKQVDDLRKVNLGLANQLAEARLKDEEIFRKRQAELDASFKQRLTELSAREADLEERRAELNDREPQHERRRLREHLTENLRNTIMTPPKEAASREWWANIAYLGAATFFIGVSLAFGLDADLGTAADAAFWTKSIKSIAAGIAGAAFAWAGLSGLRATARAGRDYERHMQR